MATEVEEPPFRRRPAPAVPTEPEKPRDGYCECGKMLTPNSDALLCVVCRQEPHVEFSERVVTLLATGMGPGEVAVELGVPRRRVRRAIRRAEAVGIGRQGAR